MCSLLFIFMKVFVVLAIILLAVSGIRVRIDSFGAIKDKDYLGVHLINQKALYAAIAAVNASTDTIK